MARTHLTNDVALELLRSNGDSIRDLTADLTDKQAAQSPAPGEWSVNEILAHLRCRADLWTAAIETMLSEDHPRIRAINPRHTIKSSPYPTMPFRQSFSQFQDQRAHLLTTLESLAPGRVRSLRRGLRSRRPTSTNGRVLRPMACPPRTLPPQGNPTRRNHCRYRTLSLVTWRNTVDLRIPPTLRFQHYPNQANH